MLTVIAQEEDTCGAVCDWVLQRTDNQFLADVVGSAIPDVLRVVAIFAVAWLLNRVVSRLIKRLVKRMVEDDEPPLTGLRKMGPLVDSQTTNPQRAAMRTQTVGAVLRSVSTLVIWSVAILVAVGSLETVDINLGPLIASAGIVGVALGFGAQSLVKDFLTGIFMLLEDQYGIGDIVNLGPATGVVERISLRKTQLRDLEGTVWHIPNGEISRVGNLSQLWSRTLIDFEVAYDTDLRHAMDVIRDTAERLAGDPEYAHMILEKPEVWGVENFAESSIKIRMVVKTEPAKQWEVNRQLRLRMKEAFDDAGIEIPFPQRTLWFRDAPSNGQPSPFSDGQADPAPRAAAAAEHDPEHASDVEND